MLVYTSFQPRAILLQRRQNVDKNFGCNSWGDALGILVGRDLGMLFHGSKTWPTKKCLGMANLKLMNLPWLKALLFFFFKFIFIYVWMCTCLSVCLPHVCKCLWMPEEGFTSLETRVQAVVSHHVGERNQTQVSGRAARALHCPATALALKVLPCLPLYLQSQVQSWGMFY